MNLTALLPGGDRDLLNVFESRRDRIILTLFVVWAASFVVVLTGFFQAPAQSYVTGEVCAPGNACGTGAECFATGDGGRCVESGYVTASCDWHETAAVAESYPQQVVCRTSLVTAAAKIVLAPGYALKQVL